MTVGVSTLYGLYSTLSLYATLVCAVLAGVIFAPQPIKRDRRVRWLVLVVIVVAALAHGAHAEIIAVDCTYRWWDPICWF